MSEVHDSVPRLPHAAPFLLLDRVLEVRAGDALRVEAEIVRIFAGAVLFRGRALVDGAVCAEGRLTLALPR